MGLFSKNSDREEKQARYNRLAKEDIDFCDQEDMPDEDSDEYKAWKRGMEERVDLYYELQESKPLLRRLFGL